jgi:hypothetical protein
MQQRKQSEGKLKEVQWPKAYDTFSIRYEDNSSIISRFNLHSCDGGIGSSIATSGIIAVRCIREKCEWLLVADEENHNQCQHREWCNKPWDDLLHRHDVHGHQSARNAQPAMPRSIP